MRIRNISLKFKKKIALNVKDKGKVINYSYFSDYINKTYL